MSHVVQRLADRTVTVESSDKMWSIREGDGKPFQYPFHENPMNNMKRQKDMTQKDKLPRFTSTTHPVTGDGSEVPCCEEQYCTGTWNVRSMNRGK